MVENHLLKQLLEAKKAELEELKDNLTSKAEDEKYYVGIIEELDNELLSEFTVAEIRSTIGDKVKESLDRFNKDNLLTVAKMHWVYQLVLQKQKQLIKLPV